MAYVPNTEKPKSISPFWVLLLCVIINMTTFFITYRMVIMHEKDLNTFIFTHKNNPLEYHPVCEKLAIRVSAVEDSIEIMKNSR